MVLMIVNNQMIYYTENLPTSKMSYTQLDNILNHACDILKMNENITLEIEFTYELDFPLYGDADVEDEVANIRINRRASKRDMITTLFHELVHINQMMNGSLKIGEGSEPSLWYGREYLNEYLQLPWEKQAFELETHMMKTYMEKYDAVYD